MQDPTPVNESPTPQSRDAKIAILRKSGYAADRCAGLEGAAPMPPVLDLQPYQDEYVGEEHPTDRAIIPNRFVD